MDMILASGISIDVAASGSEIRSEASDNAVISVTVPDNASAAAHSAARSVQKASSNVSQKTLVKEASSEVPTTGLVPGEKRSNRSVADA